MSQILTDYIPAIIALAIMIGLIWAGFNRVARVRAKALAQGEAYLKAMNRNTEMLERIAAALEARNQNRPL